MRFGPTGPCEGASASFGLPRNAELYELTELAAEMYSRHPLVGVRLIGQNSVEVADAIRERTLEAGLVVLPVDGEGARTSNPSSATRCSTRRPTPSVRATPDPDRRAVRQPARALRRPLRQHRPDAASAHRTPSTVGGRLAAHIEVEYLAAALGWPRSASATRSSREPPSTAAYPGRPAHTTFEEPLYDMLAIAKQRSLPLSPATRELLSIALERLGAFERRRTR